MAQLMDRTSNIPHQSEQRVLAPLLEATRNAPPDHPRLPQAPGESVREPFQRHLDGPDAVLHGDVHLPSALGRPALTMAWAAPAFCWPGYEWER